MTEGTNGVFFVVGSVKPRTGRTPFEETSPLEGCEEKMFARNVAGKMYYGARLIARAENPP